MQYFDCFQHFPHLLHGTPSYRSSSFLSREVLVLVVLHFGFALILFVVLEDSRDLGRGKSWDQTMLDLWPCQISQMCARFSGPYRVLIRLVLLRVRRSSLCTHFSLSQNGDAILCCDSLNGWRSLLQITCRQPC